MRDSGGMKNSGSHGNEKKWHIEVAGSKWVGNLLMWDISERKEPRITTRFYIWQILKINGAINQCKEYIGVVCFDGEYVEIHLGQVEFEVSLGCETGAV